MSERGMFREPEGATPITEEDKELLIPTWVATRGDLNRVEAENILAGTSWAYARAWSVENLTHDALRGLHRRMFGMVWAWAGQYRQVDTNLGVAWMHVPTEVEALLLDLGAQTSDRDALLWSTDELAVRFHHRLVSIHAFPNGNGRHARLAADLVSLSLSGRKLSWGAGSQLPRPGDDREEYLAALRTADQEGDYDDLISFATR